MPPLPPPKPAVDPHARAFDDEQRDAFLAEAMKWQSEEIRRVGEPIFAPVRWISFAEACKMFEPQQGTDGLCEYLEHNERRKAR